MSLPVKAKADLDHLAKEAAVAIRFEQVKRANFYFVFNLMSKATLYQIDGIYLATFDRSQFRLLSTILHEIREWKHKTIYANGRPSTSVFSIINWLDCYLTALEADQPRDHCREVIDNPFIGDGRRIYKGTTIDLFDNKFNNLKLRSQQWNLPCKFLKPHLNFYKDDQPRAIEKLEAEAAETNCNLCPYFSAREFVKL